MKKVVSIFLMALYAMAVSASIVTVRSCDVMQGGVAISVIDNNDCCCAGMHCMEMANDLANTIAPNVADTNGNAAVYTAKSSQKTCCTEIVLQSKLVANQPGSTDINLIFAQVPHILPSILPGKIKYLAANLNMQHAWRANSSPQPMQVPLYKLFNRLTYYG